MAIQQCDLRAAACPETVERILRDAADLYRESDFELAAARQDKRAGAIWSDFARILERAADSCERARNKRGL